VLQNETNTTSQIKDPNEFSGSKIPITELIMEIKNKEGDVIYRDIKVLIGINIPSTRIDDERKKMREKASSILRRNQHARRTT
jgi:hypothetical protein